MRSWERVIYVKWKIKKNMQTGICTKVETKDFFFKQKSKIKRARNFVFLLGRINDKKRFFLNYF
jgi:hypothetical protein